MPFILSTRPLASSFANELLMTLRNHSCFPIPMGGRRWRLIQGQEIFFYKKQGIWIDSAFKDKHRCISMIFTTSILSQWSWFKDKKSFCETNIVTSNNFHNFYSIPMELGSSFRHYRPCRLGLFDGEEI